MAIPQIPLQTGGAAVQVPRYTPQQQSAFDLLRNMGLQGVQKGQDFGPFEEQARRGFEARTIPTLAERFAGANAIGSSGYKNALTQAGTEFELGLNAQRAQHGLGQQSLSANLLNLGLQPQFDTSLQQSPYAGFAQGALQSLPQFAELGLKYGLGGFGGQQGQQPEQQGNQLGGSSGQTQGSSLASNLKSGLEAAGTAASAIGGLGLGAKLAGLGAAAAPFALPALAAAGVVAFPLLLHKLLS